MSITAKLLQSRIGVSETAPEPACDIAAQVAALCDIKHPKNAVFLAAGENVPNVPDYIIVLRRLEGVLLTCDTVKAHYFGGLPFVTDDDLALILGYPESKAAVISKGNYCVVQARDAKGNIVIEALASGLRIRETIDEFTRYGRVVITDPERALQRRMEFI